MIANAVVSEILEGISFPSSFRLVSSTKLPNEILSRFEVLVQNSETVQVVRFDVWVSEYDGVVLGYRINDYLGNVLSVLNDDTVQPYFYVQDHRQYMADLGRVAVRFGRSRWL